MRLDTFKIEEWMNYYCPTAKYDLTTTCIEPLSLRELLILCNIQNASEITDVKLTYGDIHGSSRLKNAIKSLYENQEFENITVTHGGIGANQLVFESLLEKGDEVICLIPTYQQLYSIPKALGANVKLIYLREENKWLPHLRDIENNITRKTKLICINNPNNPTGAVIPDELLEQIVEIAKENNSWILSDEVYRGLNLFGNPYSKSIADLYEKGISVGSMSKTYSLPGLRVGWVCGRNDLIAEINKHREYNTISVSILDDYFSSLAIENRDKIAERNFRIMREGRKILEDWLNNEVYIKANLPQGGTSAILRYKKDISSKILCRNLQNKTGVALLPGETMDLEGTVRVGYCTEPETLKIGLKEFSKFLRTL
ncbi:MAG: aminotransferase class I/II-fold pyridoxal phosphate-dependent enzyme [bacterium]|nr:aminotransferase class I/II-fold pyridoxal phosphate-dependent enzyme [bacterium]